MLPAVGGRGKRRMTKRREGGSIVDYGQIYV